MFPRAHAVAYVMMSYRIAYFKVYHPAEFYAVYFTTKVSDFNDKVILQGSLAVQEKMEEIIKVHFEHVEENVLKQVLATFYWIRGLYNIQKKPSTSEVIDWIRALELGGVPSYKIKETVPFAGVLLKKNEDIDTMRRYLK